jgi:putative transposase
LHRHLYQGSKTNKNPEFGFIDKTYAQFKSDALSPWLADCPSQILRNAATLWYDTQWKFMRGECGPPKRKHRGNGGSVWLTNELFRFGRDPATGALVIEIGTEKNPIGVIRVKWRKNRKFETPNSLTLKVNSRNKWTVSFSFDDKNGDDCNLIEHQKNWKAFALDLSAGELANRVEALDVGVNIPVATTSGNFNFSSEELASLKKQENKRKQGQKKLAKQLKGSKRRNKTKLAVAKTFEKQKNLRKDFAHKTSHALVHKTSKSIFITEDLQLKNMTASASGTIEEPGRSVSQKSGLNRAILNVGWGQIMLFLNYKALRAGKIVFKINAQYTSQECAKCGHTHLDNRPEQKKFACGKCNFTANADYNAALVIKSRAIKLLKDSGTELSVRGVLRPSRKDIGRSSYKRLNVGARGTTQPVKNEDLHLQL